MELVYLWVEEYKNIKRQGFNFSPRFRCEFKAKYKEDENGNKVLDEENSELIIEENDDYIENFFGENINVTAIVGKNGSGKSSVLKLIFLLLFCKNYDMEDNPIYHNNIIELIRPFVNKELFLILWDGDKYKKISMKNFIETLVEKKSSENIIAEVTDLKKYLPRNKEEIDSCCLIYKEAMKEEIKTFFIHFNYMLDTLYDGEQDKWIKEIYHKADSYEMPLLLEPYKNNNNRQIIDLEIIEYLNNQNLLRFYNKLSSNKNITKFFNPNYIKYYNPIFSFPDDISDKDFKCLEESGFLGISNKFWNMVKSGESFIDIEEFDDNFCKIVNQIGEWYEKKDYKKINLLYIALKVLSSNKKLFNENEYKKYRDWLLHLKQNQYDITSPTIGLTKLIKEDAPNYEVRKIKTCIEFNEKYEVIKDGFIENIAKNVSINSIKDMLNIIPPWVNVEFYEDSKSMSSLSSGEKTFFTFLINLMYQVQNLNDRNDYETIYLFLDETELGFHPQWQKEYLNNLFFALKSINTKPIYIIFATHSPFLLSDIPKENIMFLNNGEQVKGIEKKQTFGANIHTLLSDSFFMEDGLMGEFAKGKIQQIINILNGKLSSYNCKFRYVFTKEYFSTLVSKNIKKVIEAIGEPFLKDKLLQMYEKKYPKTDEERIRELEAEIKRIRSGKD